MLGVKQYILSASALSVGLGLLLALMLASQGAGALVTAAFAWGVMSAIGVIGGGLAVYFHGNAGPGFPLTVLTCILLRLFSGLGGILIAVRVGQLNAYLIALFTSFFLMSAFEMIWFLRRGRLLTTEGRREAIG